MRRTTLQRLIFTLFAVILCAISPANNPANAKSERYFSDDLRRIQEFVTSPLNPNPWGSPVSIEDEAEQEEAGEGTSAPPPAGREYVFGPGSLDEYVCQLENNVPYYILQDANLNVLAVVNASGAVVQQRVFSPYGEPIVRRDPGTSVDCRLGHQGLHWYRLDGAVGATSLAGNSLGFYHNVNRALDPRKGRFLQRDPNASGQTLNFTENRMGVQPNISSARFDVLQLYGDGLSLHVCTNSNPINRSDALGLDDDDYDAEEFYEDATDVLGMLDAIPGPSDFIRGALEGLVKGYAANLSADIDWAFDWSADDDDHSRTDDDWIPFAIGTGLAEAFDVGLPGSDNVYDPLDHFANGKSKSSGPGAPSAGGGKKRTGGYGPANARGHEKHRAFYERMLHLGIDPNKKIPKGRG